MTDSKKVNTDRRTADKNGILWSDEERKFFMTSKGFDPVKGKPPVILEAEGGSGVKLTLELPEVSEGYDKPFKDLLETTLKFICHLNAFGPQHPSNLRQLEWLFNQENQ